MVVKRVYLNQVLRHNIKAQTGYIDVSKLVSQSFLLFKLKAPQGKEGTYFTATSVVLTAHLMNGWQQEQDYQIWIQRRKLHSKAYSKRRVAQKYEKKNELLAHMLSPTGNIIVESPTKNTEDRGMSSSLLGRLYPA